MENPMTFRQHYADHRRQSAWINAHDWQFEKAEKRHPVRAMVAKALIALADAITPTTRREAGTA